MFIQSGISSGVREHFVFPTSFCCTDLLPSHHPIFLHFCCFDRIKGCKNYQVACNVVGHFFLVFSVRDHLCALKAYIRGKQHVTLVLYVVYKQLKCSSHSWIGVWLIARLLRWSCWHNQNIWLVGACEAAGAIEFCTDRLLLESAACPHSACNRITSLGWFPPFLLSVGSLR